MQRSIPADMPQVFISYRSLDSIDITSRLWEHLKARLGDRHVFIDYGRITGGEDFIEVIDHAVDSSEVVLCVIGVHWKMRIHDHTDVVRRELERAQRSGKPILPVLVGGASHLSSDDLPDSLKKLATTHALELRSGLDFGGDVQRILECLEKLTCGTFTSCAPIAGTSRFPFSPPFTSATSGFRSAALVAFRASSITFVTLTGYGFLYSLLITPEIRSFPRLTLLRSSALLVASIGIGLLVTTLLRIRLVAHFGRRRQQAALLELASLIVSRADTPHLLSATSVRSLAMGIEQKHRCSVITDKLIIEAIRAAAITLEHATRGRKFVARLKLLNDLLLSIDKDASAMCSVAVVDRLSAYVQSQPILVCALLLALTLSMISPLGAGAEWGSGILAIATCITAMALLLWLSTERAIRYWRSETQHARPVVTTFMAMLCAPRLLTDFLLIASCTRAKWADRFWNVVWGPFVWENIMFAWKSGRQLAAMHEFRFDVARTLWHELKTMDIMIEQRADEDAVEGALLHQRFREGARQLWIVTGEPQFRTIELRGTIERDDLKRGIVGLL